MKILDRLTNKEIDFSALPTKIETYGRYKILSVKGNCFQNGIQLAEGDYLNADESNNCQIDFSNAKYNFKYDEKCIKPPFIKDSLTQIYAESKTKKLNDIKLVLRNINENIHITEFEELLEKKLFHIEYICRNPNTKLSREYEKMPVSKAKRVPVKAINYLAAHSEDWSRRRIRSVEPKRIIAEFLDANIDIYENRITASLITQLVIYLNKRSSDLKDISEYITEVEGIINNYQKGKDKIWHKKIRRNYEIIGDLYENSISETTNQITVTSEYINKLKKRLLILFSSELYHHSTKINTKNRVLKQTNLLDNDKNYRFVKILWKELNTKKKEISEEEKYKAEQEYVKSYFNYFALQLFKAIEHFDFIDLSENQPNYKEQKNWLHDNYSFEINYTWSNNDEAIIKIGETSISFLPFLSDINFETKKTNELQYIVTQKKAKEYKTYTRHATTENKTILPIDMMDVDSFERISAILRWHIFEEHSKSYEQKIDTQIISNYNNLKDFILQNKEFEEDDNLKNVKLIHPLSRQKIEILKKEIKTAQQNLTSKHKLRTRQSEEIEDVEKLILSKNEKLEKSLFCIDCYKPVTKTIRDNDIVFKCKSKECNIEFGIKNSKPYYKVPKFEGIIQENLKTQEFSLNLVEKLFGRDILSYPIFENDKLKF